MEDDELGRRIRDAAPRVTVPAGLASHRAQILAEARGRRGRRLRVWAAGVAASGVLIGGGSVAMAGAGNETPWGWVADNVFSIERTNGSACFQGIVVRWEGLSEDDPLVQDAKAIVGGIDLATLDTSAKEEQIRADLAASEPVEHLDGEITSIEMSDAEVKQQAIHQLVAEQLWAGLGDRVNEMQPGREVSLSSQTSDCS
ncbi:hypothetical protein HDC37_001330 [Microbacterium sp. AK009]|uniref:hypothetical protein n=1 Tax=Microbacterium sp. AK009 TaxID=2723068 RepID=UPI0015C862F0|nr:hypothetical protein [Microbacterium sp. AK009]NYF16505.1 hypothetical protein [Microbacterium sp. AK009]